MKKQTFKPLGGILDPNLLNKQIYMPDYTVNNMAKSLNNHFKKEDKAIIKNFATIEIKESKRTTRYNLKTKSWIACKPKKRVSVKLNKKFIGQVLQNNA